ncbi:hypothetical protein [Saccharothrix sp. HUAS TT1]|uniref:hypothetical protein n=1 Tax=unclassified Saccharothrix TaxID=2593673 RepID=UPI00345BF408
MTVSLDIAGGIAVIRLDGSSDTVLPDVRAVLPAIIAAGAAVLRIAPDLSTTDLKRLLTASPSQREAIGAALRGVRDELAELPVPIVAAIGGCPSGEAAELALACDRRVLAADGGLGWVTGDRVLVARRVTADEALRTGLVDRVVPASAVLRVAVELANECKRAQAERNSCPIVAT